MRNKSKIAFLFLSLMIFTAGCASTAPSTKVVSANPALLKVQPDKPNDEGPFIVSVGNGCARIFKTWKKIAVIKGQNVWGVETSFNYPVDCQ